MVNPWPIIGVAAFLGIAVCVATLKLARPLQSVIRYSLGLAAGTAVGILTYIIIAGNV
jgi:uncharacterized membrane protein